ncbi:MAG: HD domain-containing protein [Tissierellia bacterium]|nr:HD domain-containing protein [Tissierellia bacterium]
MKEFPKREEVLKLFLKYNESEALYKHALQVEAVMRHFAEVFNENPDEWGVVGLIHDLDYEKYPDRHCEMTEKILREEDYPEEFIRAVLSHGYKIVTDIEPLSNMEKVLYTIDELTGLINATCLMRPSRSVLDLSVKSLNKKFKDKRFAAGVDREIILDGMERLGWDRQYLFEETIKGMQKYAEEIGLKGNL